jgi:hypothetical protein
MSFNEDPVFIEIVIHGKFFFPAWKHYNNPTTDVRCDRCFKTNLVSCIGHMDRDLCLNCADIVCNKNKHTVQPYPPIIPKPIDPYYPYITRMEQSFFKK